jgi:hypothetical protein
VQALHVLASPQVDSNFIPSVHLFLPRQRSPRKGTKEFACPVHNSTATLANLMARARLFASTLASLPKLKSEHFAPKPKRTWPSTASRATHKKALGMGYAFRALLPRLGPRGERFLSARTLPTSCTASSSVSPSSASAGISRPRLCVERPVGLSPAGPSCGNAAESGNVGAGAVVTTGSQLFWSLPMGARPEPPRAAGR